MELFAGSREDSTGRPIQAREGRGLRKGYPAGRTFALRSGDHRAGRAGHGARATIRDGADRVAVLVALALASRWSPAATRDDRRLRRRPTRRRPAPTQSPPPVARHPRGRSQDPRRYTERSTSRSSRSAASRSARPSTRRSSRRASPEAEPRRRGLTGQTPPALLVAYQRLYQQLGLLPAGASLHDLYSDLLESQVAGYYDPDTKELYVVSEAGPSGPTEQITFAHGVRPRAPGPGTSACRTSNSTRSAEERRAALAQLAIPEGDSTLLMMDAGGHRTFPRRAAPCRWAREERTGQAKVLAEGAANPKANALPASLRLSGLKIGHGVTPRAGGWAAVDALYAKPPASTEQVLHPRSTRPARCRSRSPSQRIWRPVWETAGPGRSPGHPASSSSESGSRRRARSLRGCDDRAAGLGRGPRRARPQRRSARGRPRHPLGQPGGCGRVRRCCPDALDTLSAMGR